MTQSRITLRGTLPSHTASLSDGYTAVSTQKSQERLNATPLSSRFHPRYQHHVFVRYLWHCHRRRFPKQAEMYTIMFSVELHFHLAKVRGAAEQVATQWPSLRQSPLQLSSTKATNGVTRKVCCAKPYGACIHHVCMMHTVHSPHTVIKNDRDWYP